MHRLRALRKRLDPLTAELRHAERCLAEESASLEGHETHAAAAEEARAMIQETAEAVQRRAHLRISTIVTRCLKAVFGEDAYEFGIEFEQKRGRTEANLHLVRNSERVDPVGAVGGGVVDVCSFALRLACLVLSRPPRRKLLVLDEPAKHLSREYRPAFRGVMEALSEELGVQIIFVTHSEELVTGRVVEL